jgi:hypothetical protein
MDQGRAQILSRADGGRMTIEQNMVCTDRPEIQVRQVRIGDQVRESEVRPHPNFPKLLSIVAPNVVGLLSPRFVAEICYNAKVLFVVRMVQIGR